MPVFAALDRVAAATGADPLLQRLATVLNKAPVAARDALHGVWLGHPLHPVTAQLPVGAWLGAAVLDGVATVAPSAAVRDGAERSARTLILTGLLAVPAAALPGAADWAQLHPEQQRVGALHAVTNTVAAGLLAASLVQRRRGNIGRGRLLGLLGVSTASLAAGIGGHLSYRYAAGANHAEDVPHRTTTGEWLPVCHLDVLPDGTPQRYTIGGTPAAVVRQNGTIAVLADACSHLSGPLSEGTLEDGCLVCPWHGSAFRLDGSVRHGPATAPQPRFDVRVVDGLVEARIVEP